MYHPLIAAIAAMAAMAMSQLARAVGLRPRTPHWPALCRWGRS